MMFLFLAVAGVLILASGSVTGAGRRQGAPPPSNTPPPEPTPEPTPRENKGLDLGSLVDAIPVDRLHDVAKWAGRHSTKAAKAIMAELPAALKSLTAVAPVVLAGAALSYVAVRYVVAQILNFPAFNLGGAGATRNTVDTVHFAPGVLFPRAEAALLSEGYEYDQHIQLSLAQDIAGSSEPTPENVLIVRPGYEDHLLLSEDGAGVSRYTPNIEPAGDLREPETVAAIMGDRYTEDMI